MKGKWATAITPKENPTNVAIQRSGTIAIGEQELKSRLTKELADYFGDACTGCTTYDWESGKDHLRFKLRVTLHANWGGLLASDMNKAFTEQVRPFLSKQVDLQVFAITVGPVYLMPTDSQELFIWGEIAIQPRKGLLPKGLR